MSQNTNGGAIAPIWEHFGYLGDLMAAAGIDSGDEGVTYTLWLSIEKIVEDWSHYEDLVTNIKVGEAQSEPEAWQKALSIVQAAQYDCPGQNEQLRKDAQDQVVYRICGDLARTANLDSLLRVLIAYSDEDWYFVRDNEQVAEALRQAFDRAASETLQQAFSRIGAWPAAPESQPTAADLFHPFPSPSSSTLDILNTFAGKLGWNTDTMLAVLADYIDNQQGQNALHDYLLQRAAAELEAGQDDG